MFGKSRYKYEYTSKQVDINRLVYSPSKSNSIISYTYTALIATKICDCKHVLQDLNIDDFKSKPPKPPKFISWKQNFKFLWIPSRVIPDKGQRVNQKT